MAGLELGLHVQYDVHFYLSSFSLRDILRLSASDNFRVTSLETASSRFCATLEGDERKNMSTETLIKLKPEHQTSVDQKQYNTLFTQKKKNPEC